MASQIPQIGKPREVTGVESEVLSQRAGGCNGRNLPVGGGLCRPHGLRVGEPSGDAKLGGIFAPSLREGLIAEEEIRDLGSSRMDNAANGSGVSLRERPEPAPATAEGFAGAADHVIDGGMAGAKTLGYYFNQRRFRHGTAEM